MLEKSFGGSVTDPGSPTGNNNCWHFIESFLNCLRQHYDMFVAL